MKSKRTIATLVALFLAVFIATAQAGTPSKIPWGVVMPEISTPASPPTDYGRLYVADYSGTTSLYFLDHAGTATNLLTSATGTAMVSSLSGNLPDVANGVWGASNSLVFEGATANAYETSITSTDATADRTITIPDRTGTVTLDTVSVTAKTTSPVTVTTAYAGQVLTNSGASGAIIFNLPEASTCIGQIYTLAVLTAQNLDINPGDADQILGLTNAAGDAIRNAVAGGTVRLMAVDATNWVVTGSYGTWSDVN